MSRSSNGGTPVSQVYHYNSLWGEYFFDDDDWYEERDYISPDCEPEFRGWLKGFQYLGCTCESCKLDERQEELKRISRALEETRIRIEEASVQIERASDKIELLCAETEVVSGQIDNLIERTDQLNVGVSNLS